MLVGGRACSLLVERFGRATTDFPRLALLGTARCALASKGRRFFLPDPLFSQKLGLTLTVAGAFELFAWDQGPF